MTQLQRLLQEKPYMLRRLAQKHICDDRGIKSIEVAQEMGVHRDSINLYWQGRNWKGTNASGNVSEHYEKLREEYEDRVERAIEALSKKKRFLAPRVVGTPEETYITDAVLLPDLMRAP